MLISTLRTSILYKEISNLVKWILKLVLDLKTLSFYFTEITTTVMYYNAQISLKLRYPFWARARMSLEPKSESCLVVDVDTSQGEPF